MKQGVPTSKLLPPQSRFTYWPVTPDELIFLGFSRIIKVHDTITTAKFHDYRLHGFDFMGKNPEFPLYLRVTIPKASTAVLPC
jgi:hypothetical protein